jgi:hypothetical protein
MVQSLSNTKPIRIDYESETDDCRYEGPFTIKRMAIMDFNKQQIRKLQLNGGYHYVDGAPGAGISYELDLFNDMLAHLEVAVVKAPEWWDLNKITDVGLLNAVHKEVIAFENSFLNRRPSSDQGTGTNDGASPSGSGSQSQESQPREDVSQVVDPEVQSSLQP